MASVQITHTQRRVSVARACVLVCSLLFLICLREGLLNSKHTSSLLVPSRRARHGMFMLTTLAILLSSSIYKTGLRLSNTKKRTHRFSGEDRVRRVEFSEFFFCSNTAIFTLLMPILYLIASIRVFYIDIQKTYPSMLLIASSFTTLFLLQINKQKKPYWSVSGSIHKLVILLVIGLSAVSWVFFVATPSTGVFAVSCVVSFLKNDNNVLVLNNSAAFSSRCILYTANQPSVKPTNAEPTYNTYLEHISLGKVKTVNHVSLSSIKQSDVEHLHLEGYTNYSLVSKMQEIRDLLSVHINSIDSVFAPVYYTFCILFFVYVFL